MQQEILDEITHIMTAPKSQLSNKQKETLIRKIESQHDDLFIQIEHCTRCKSIIVNVWIKQAVHHS